MLVDAGHPHRQCIMARVPLLLHLSPSNPHQRLAPLEDLATVDLPPDPLRFPRPVME